MLKNRRTFLMASAGAVGGAVLLGYFGLPSAPQDEQFIAIGVLNPKVRKNYTDDDRIVQAMNQPSYINLYDLRRWQNTQIESPGSMHQISQLRLSPSTLVCTPKWAQTMMVVDKDFPKNVSYLKAPKELAYCGHFCEDLTGHFLFVGAQENRPFGRGIILVYSTKTWDLVQQFSTEYILPHDMKMLDSGTIVISQKKKLPETLETTGVLSIAQVQGPNVSKLRHFPVEHAGHLTVLADQRLLVAGWQPKLQKSYIDVFNTVDFSAPSNSLWLGGFWGEPLNVVIGLDGDLVVGFSDRKGYGSLRFMNPVSGHSIHVGGLEMGAVVRVGHEVYFVEGLEGWLRKLDLRTPSVHTYVGRAPIGFGPHGTLILG